MSNWSEAQTALERARGRLGDRGFSDLRGLLDQADRDQAAAARLDQDSLEIEPSAKEGDFGNSRSIAEYESAFRDCGIGDRGDDPALVASRIERSNIQAMPCQLPSKIGLPSRRTRPILIGCLQVARQASTRSDRVAPAGTDIGCLDQAIGLAELIASAPVTENSVPLLLRSG